MTVERMECTALRPGHYVGQSLLARDAIDEEQGRSGGPMSEGRRPPFTLRQARGERVAQRRVRGDSEVKRASLGASFARVD